MGRREQWQRQQLSRRWTGPQPLSNLTDSSKGQLNAPFLARPEAVIFDKDGTLVVRSVPIN